MNSDDDVRQKTGSTYGMSEDTNNQLGRQPVDENDSRDQELLWPARTHPDELILPDAHPTRFPGTWVAIFEGSLPIDQVRALEVNGFGLYRHVVACPNGNLQVIIREDQRPDRNDELDHDATMERYDQYEHPGVSAE